MKDHKNLTKLNTGFVRELFIEDLQNGGAKLKAKLDFTEPDVKAKVQRGTIPDVSAGVYFDVERPDGTKFNSAINHLCLSVKPFMDGLNPFGVLAEDDESSPSEIEGFVPPVAVVDPPKAETTDAQETEVDEPQEPAEPEPMKFEPTRGLFWRQEKLTSALTGQLKLDGEKYIVKRHRRRHGDRPEQGVRNLVDRTLCPER